MLGVLTIPSLKEEFLELLEKDREFRYAIIGYLGLDRIEKTQTAILEEIKRIWEEIKALRESQTKLWEEVNKIWKEVKSLREDQEKLWKEVKALREGQEKLWEEVKALREGQNKLWEGQEKLWLEVKALRESQNKLWEGQNKLWEEVKALREGQNKLWEEVKALREDQGRLWRYVKSGFKGIHEALGTSFEEYVASFIRFTLYELGYTDARVEVRKHMIYEGQIVEVNVFSEEPLVIGEATLKIGDINEADREVRKLVERAEIVSKVYGKKPFMKVLAVGNAPEEVFEYLKKLTIKYDIKLVIGREIREVF